MAVGLQRVVRRALLTRLKSNAPLIALVPAASIFSSSSDLPEKPFVLLSSPTEQPIRASCVRGGTVTWDVHAFAGPVVDGTGAVTQTAEDHASAIGAAIETALADNNLALEGGGNARIRLSDKRMLPDDTPNAFHWFAQVNCRVLAE
ncbi:MAG: DUF3168 domain-containing protein [Pseudomonadota bacterium]